MASEDASDLTKVGNNENSDTLIFDLPEEIKNFSKSYELLNENIDRYEKVLEKAQKHVDVAQHNVDKSILELGCYERKLNAMIENIAEAEENNKYLQNEIENIIDEIEEINRLTIEKELTREDESKRFESMRERMREYNSKSGKDKDAHLCNHGVPNCEEICSEEKQMELHNDMETVDGDIQIENLKNEIALLEERKLTLKNEIEHKNIQINEYKKKQKQLKLDILVLNKRNNARLLRLKRQRQERGSKRTDEQTT